jgi:hypothetical protein
MGAICCRHDAKHAGPDAGYRHVLWMRHAVGELRLASRAVSVPAEQVGG